MITLDDKEVLLVTDFGQSDTNTLAQVRRRIRKFCPGAAIENCPVVPFSDLNAAFWVCAHGLWQSGSETVLLVNCAPRAKGNREPLWYAKLPGRVHVLAYHSGYDLTLVAPQIERLYEVVHDEHVGQWRSRDVAPQVIRKIFTGELFSHQQDVLPRLGAELNPLDPTVIPHLSHNVVVHVDDYGNLKLSAWKGQMTWCEFGTRVKIQVGHNDPIEVPYLPRMFDAPVGEWCLHPGSDPAESDNPFLELCIHLERTGEAGAAQRLGATIGDQVDIVPIR